MEETYVLRVYPEAVTYSWESQVEQYPRLGAPGIQYFAGDVGALKPVDCLLWRDEQGLVHGILNYYSIDFPPHEQAGNINIFIDPQRRRQGIGSALLREAHRRWGPIDWNQQRYTESGIELAARMIAELGGKGGDELRLTTFRVNDGATRLRRKQ